MIEIREETEAGIINGTCDPKFEKVAETFVENFKSRGEIGASVNLNVEGETLVHLWGGKQSASEGTEWTEDTISIVFSCTKAATALCAHMLIDRGELNPYAKVTDYWPEFGRKGKEDTTVMMMLNHSSALPAFRDPVQPGGFLDWDHMIKRLEEEEPFWTPGTRNGYHMISFGWTVGELVRRVSGKSLGTFFKENVTDPLGIDFWIGLPEEHETRVASMIPFVPDENTQFSDFTKMLLGDPSSIQHLSFLNNGGWDVNSREGHAAEIGGGGGISNAAGLAGMYNPLANDGKAGGVELLSRNRIEAMSACSVATREDATLLIPSRFGQGFMLSMDNRHEPQGRQDSAIIGRNAFGHVGAGGSIGFADPDARLGFGYSMSKMGQSILLNDRGQSLVDAAYDCLGYGTNEPGFWVK